MADKGTIALLKTHIDDVLNNSKAEGTITPQVHNNLLKDVIDTLFPTYGTTAGIDTYTVALNITQIDFQDGKLHLLSFSDTNTGAATLNVDTLGAKGLKKNEDLDLAADDIVVGKIYEVRYDSSTDTYRINL